MPESDPPIEDDLADVPFETALAELENLVEKMETGSLTLEESLAAFDLLQWPGQLEPRADADLERDIGGGVEGQGPYRVR